MNAQLQGAIRELASRRRDRDDVARQLKALRDAFEAENARLINFVRVAGEQVAEQEDAVRALARAAFDATQDPKPAPGVEVKQFKKYRYDEGEAFAWAKRAQIALVPEKLDVRAFEKIIAATPLEFVRAEIEPRVQIATDLDKALAVADATGATTGAEA